MKPKEVLAWAEKVAAKKMDWAKQHQIFDAPGPLIARHGTEGHEPSLREIIQIYYRDYRLIRDPKACDLADEYIKNWVPL